MGILTLFRLLIGSRLSVGLSFWVVLVSVGLSFLIISQLLYRHSYWLPLPPELASLFQVVVHRLLHAHGHLAAA